MNTQTGLKNLLNELLIYDSFSQDPCICNVVDGSSLMELARELVRLAARNGFSGNLWQYAVARYIAANENAFSLAMEMKKDAKDADSDALIMRECKILREIFFYDLRNGKENSDKTVGNAETAEAEILGHIMNFDSLKEGMENPMTRQARLVDKLCEELRKTSDEKEFYQALKTFYASHGVGTFGLNRAFALQESEGSLELKPVEMASDVSFDDLVGCEIQKEMLISNTEAFLGGSMANNVLLYGDSGTGKSTSIRALLNKYSDQGLKMIQVYRHQMRYLPVIITQIRQRNYRFVIYMDDLSFEDFETEYKYLKAVIEGGLEAKPENVLIYASSNRRHFIKETHADRNDEEFDGEIFKSDTLEEKRSLADRFGVQIYFGKPSREGYHEIVEVLAERENLGISKEELHAEATKWEIRHGGVSGRCARQFIDYVKGKENLKK